MAIDVKKIQVEARRVTEFSITYVKNHPIIPAAIAFLFPLYIFLPSQFTFLVYAIPIFTFITVSFKFIFHIHQQNLRHAKGTLQASAQKLTHSRSGRNLYKRGYSYAHAQSVRRRNSKNHELRVHFEDEMDKKEIPLPLVNKATLVEETMKEIREVEVEVPKANDKSKLDLDDGSGLRARKIREISEDEEESPENRNKAVEWSEDDQKNLTDLGLSDVERNKRLESLIAKRKARKLLSLQVRRTLMKIGKAEPSNEIASILIPKAGTFSRTKSGEAIISPTPGSAPSVLLPMHNPFDLPYDPQEEKPNLLGGFQEELLDNHHSDAVFRRHESFNLGPSPKPWELDLDPSPSESSHHFETMPMIREILQFSRSKNQSGKEGIDEITQIDTSQESKTSASTSSSRDPFQQNEAAKKALDLNTNKVEDFIKDNNTNLNDANSSDSTNKVEGCSKLDTDDTQESISSSSSEINVPFSNANREQILKSLSFSVRKNIQVLENPSQYENNVGNDPFFDSIHTRTTSVASDMQVEVSEAGSQIANLSSDGESPKYDLNVETRPNFGNEKINKDIEQHNSLQSNQNRSSDIIKSQKQEDSSNSVEKFLADKRIVYDMRNHTALHHNSMESIEESSSPIEKFLADKQIVYDINKRVGFANDDQGIIDFIQYTYGQDVETINQGNLQDLSAPTLKNKGKSINIVEESSKQPENDSQVKEILVEKGPSEASSSTSTRSMTKDKDPSIPLEKSKQQIELNKIKNSCSQSSVSNNQDGTSGINPALARPTEPIMFLGTDPTPIAVIPQVAAVEQVAAPLNTSSSSPNSVLQHKFSVDLATSVSLDDIHLASVTSNADVAQNATSQDNSSADVARASDSAGLQESSVPISHSTEVNTNLNINDRAANKGTEDKLVHTNADIGSLTPKKENEKNGGVKGVDATKELQISNDLGGPSKLDNIIDNAPKDSIADKTRAGNSAGLQESSLPIRSSMEENKSNNINDKATNEGTKDKLVLQMSADIHSLTPTEESKNSETMKGVEAIKALPKMHEGDSNIDNTIDNVPKDSTADKTKEGMEDKFVKTRENQANIGLQMPIIEKGKVDASKEVKTIEESKRTKEFEGDSKLQKTTSSSEAIGIIEENRNSVKNDISTNKSTEDKLVQTNADIGSLKLMEENKKIETKKGGEVIEELQRAKEIEMPF